MKNIMFMLIIVVMAYGLWQYSQPNQELLDAKKELGIEVDSSIDSKVNEAKKEIFEQVDDAISGIQETVEEIVEEKAPMFEIKLLSGNDILQLDDFKESDIGEGGIDLTGKINAPVDGVRVLFTNPDSEYPDDDYPLQQFVAGSDKFLYRAYSQYKTFDFGENIYTIVMTSGKEESRLQLTINYPNPEDVEEKSDNNDSIDTSVEKINSDNLPTSGEYGSPIKTGENKITYSDLKGFELEKHSVIIADCTADLVTSTIAEKTSSWSWWNTCRPSGDKSYVTYYALNMKDGEYVYAKHYFSNNYYAIMELSTGEDESWASLETVTAKNEWLKTKNNELKELNSSFEITKITDTLFENIIKK